MVIDNIVRLLFLVRFGVHLKTDEK